MAPAPRCRQQTHIHLGASKDWLAGLEGFQVPGWEHEWSQPYKDFLHRGLPELVQRRSPGPLGGQVSGTLLPRDRDYVSSPRALMLKVI